MTPQEQQNLANFDTIDFCGWNRADEDVLRHFHTDDVIVEWNGQHTEGIEAHLEQIRETIAAYPDAKVLTHEPRVAQGDWTAVVGLLPTGQKMVTVAKWREGAVAEEYIFMGDMPPDGPAAS